MANDSSQHGSGTKKIRMTLACERCRSKKVKCDFAHPTCGRCQQAQAMCCYEGSDTQVDLFNLMKMNETVQRLQQKVDSLEADIDRQDTPAPKRQCNTSELDAFLAAANANWSLSLTPRGLRIDTNIISLHDLYELLLSGMSQLDINTAAAAALSPTPCSSSSPSPPPESTLMSPAQCTAIVKKKPLWKTSLKIFPLYSSWAAASNDHASPPSLPFSTSDDLYSQNQDAIAVGMVPKSTLDQLMAIYTECFMCLPSPEREGSIVDRYDKGELDDMLANIVFAWTARHGAIYHDLFPGQDPNAVGRPFFNTAKLLLKQRFMDTNIDTMHTCLMMYIYAIGDPSSSESEAYMYLGLANRMCLDLKMHCEPASPDNLIACERHRRYFHALSFLETLCSVHSDRPFSLPAADSVSVLYPSVLPHEAGTEASWRIEFVIQRFKITAIYRSILFVTAKDAPLLSDISSLDKQLNDWYLHLPAHLRYKPGDLHKRSWATASFREQACIKLNCEYHFQMCQLYGLFFSRSQEPDPTHPQPLSAIDVLAKERCVQSANTIVELLAAMLQLNQRWCHFSLEAFMFAVVIYGTLLLDASPSEKEVAKTQLTQLARLLDASPVHHHKHVVELIQRIRSLIFDHFAEHLDIHADPFRTSVKRRDTSHPCRHQWTHTTATNPVHLYPPRLTPLLHLHPTRLTPLLCNPPSYPPPHLPLQSKPTLLPLTHPPWPPLTHSPPSPLPNLYPPLLYSPPPPFAHSHPSRSLCHPIVKIASSTPTS
ncbi:hypothetical protein DM01DRAFT_1136186 [Hesseltinella vesiculosa]|uniref:Zn(2)-C6 fungal-type domain-containing protein n=1 Tax=Hesseltinella vesiculosa TaxID=101127 RepID=A0A1X2G8D7_9FUNG|nr:hypothetical protein DM01DRAFT_1136186 [Hesseltinella vesiculosa]